MPIIPMIRLLHVFLIVLCVLCVPQVDGSLYQLKHFLGSCYTSIITLKEWSQVEIRHSISTRAMFVSRPLIYVLYLMYSTCGCALTLT